jgi:hypothetical protein
VTQEQSNPSGQLEKKQTQEQINVSGQQEEKMTQEQVRRRRSCPRSRLTLSF